ncbi:hypothetical protein [Streptomyces phytohabitans]|uniref:hypothetical protein n=1 Tax=Streptomyces phytohabitans TaxID=1150371 RepID=UPI00345C488D
MDLDLDAVADELYGLPPSAFTAARDRRARQARQAGDRGLAQEIRRLRRPTLAAWAGNLLARESPDGTGTLLRLGEALREAHRDLDGAQLRALAAQQRQVVAGLARQAAELAAGAGRPLGEDSLREVERTLHAALADPDAGAEWARGRLARPLAAVVGFPGVAEGGAPRLRLAGTDTPTAAPDAPPRRTRSRTDTRARTGTPPDAPVADLDAVRTRRREERRRAAEARREAADAVRELRSRTDAEAAARDAAEHAEERQRAAEAREAAARRAVKEAEAERRAARDAVRQAHDVLRAAVRETRAARRRADGTAARAEPEGAGPDGR